MLTKKLAMKKIITKLEKACQIVRFHETFVLRFQFYSTLLKSNLVFWNMNVDTRILKSFCIWIVLYSKPLKSIQIVGADFDSTIAANQLMPEVNTDFRYVVISRQNQGSNKIVTAIAPSFERRYLRSGDNHWFSCEKLIIT